jgi:leader peptidase (prepilin peptidase) / N-methyltransferase
MTTLVLDWPAWMVYPYLFAIGAVIGSFLNVCIYRIPVHGRFADQLKALWDRPSHCPRCRTNIRWSDNIPIFGWLKLRGRCRNCRMRISPRYPLIELANACLWVLVFHMEVPLGRGVSLSASCVFTELGPQSFPGLGPLSPEAFVLLRYLYHMVLIEALLVASMIDFDLRIIPDGSTLPAMAVGLLMSTLVARVHLVPVWFQLPNLQQSFAIVTPEWMHPLLAGPAVPEWVTAFPHLHGFVVSLTGLLVGGGIVWLVRILGFWALRQEAMGFGDVILMALIGAFLGWQGAVIAFFIAPVCALVAVLATVLFKRDRMIPYGPYLSLGALITLLAWQPVFAYSRRFFELGALLIPMAATMTLLFAASLMLVQGVKRLLGIQQPMEESAAYWRPADQTWFFGGERVNRHTGRWKTRDWDGCAAAHGTIHEERWRNGTSGTHRPPRRLGDG